MPDIFFNSSMKVSNISKEDYARADDYIRALAAMAKIAYGSIYIIDYFTMDFLYVSSNPLFLCGYSPDEIKKQGFSFYNTLVPKDELGLLLKINTLAFRFLISQSIEERESLTISYDFHIINKGNKLLVNHKLTPLIMDINGYAWLAVCYVSISNQDKPGNLEIRKTGQSKFWKYDLNKEQWTSVEEAKLTLGEKEVLLLSAQGKTVDEIARILNRSKDSINSRKKNIFEKLNVRSISEALTFATNFKLI